MTIDEAIKYCLETSEESDDMIARASEDYSVTIPEDAGYYGELYRNIAKWLGELKERREQPVKHGRWKPAKNGDEDYLYLSTILGIPVEDLPKYAYCSECKFSFATNGVDKTGKALIHKAVYKYCPKCGARMDDDEAIKG